VLVTVSLTEPSAAARTQVARRLEQSRSVVKIHSHRSRGGGPHRDFVHRRIPRFLGSERSQGLPRRAAREPSSRGGCEAWPHQRSDVAQRIRRNKLGDQRQQLRGLIERLERGEQVDPAEIDRVLGAERR
jgi:hypothetical protein